MDNFCEKTQERVLEFCKKNNLLTRHSEVVVAVSGGADSMALLRLLLGLAPTFAWKVSACHINHCLRGADAEADEAFVRAECSRLRVPLIAFHAVKDGNLLPENAGEAWARELRYGYFEQLIAEKDCLLATAHTLNDQAETLLFRLARGTGAHGAAGIAARRGQYIRPMLSLSRAEVERYCKEIGQDYVTDCTNLEVQYARNHLRAHAIPSLCYANEAAVQHLGQFCEKMSEIDCYFDAQAKHLLQTARLASQEVSVAHNRAEKTQITGTERFSLAALSAAESLILEHAVYQLVFKIRDAEQKYVKAIVAMIQAGTGAVQVCKNVRFFIQDDFLQVEYGAEQAVKIEPTVEYYPVAPGKYFFSDGYCVKIEMIEPNIMEKIHLVHKKDLKNYANYDKIKASFQLRCRMQGDTFSPAGRGVTKTVKKLHNELAVPKSERNKMPLLANGHEVVWLWGQGVAEHYIPDATTKSILKITEVKNTEEE